MPVPPVLRLLHLDARRSAIADLVRRARRRRAGRIWVPQGPYDAAPDWVKVDILRWYAKRFSLFTLVETGTYKGDTIQFLKHDFLRIFSIELDRELHEGARRRFGADRHITLHQGDSAETLPRVLEAVPERCLFWLDGHYSGGITARGALSTPIRAELSHILARSTPDVILIDDARCFARQLTDYPSIDDVRASVAAARPGWSFSVESDIIRIHPPVGN